MPFTNDGTYYGIDNRGYVWFGHTFIPMEDSDNE